MTSSAKNNHEHITSLCERLGWFGRGRSSFQLFEQVCSWKLLRLTFFLFELLNFSPFSWLLSKHSALSSLVLFYFQPLVPAVGAEDGQWLVSKPFGPVCKPGGHGVIWKLAYDKGIFGWFYGHGRKGATVRQVRSTSSSLCFKVNICYKIKLANLHEFGYNFYHGGDFAVMLLLVQIWPF